jgi:hypothetical protein
LFIFTFHKDGIHKGYKKKLDKGGSFIYNLRKRNMFFEKRELIHSYSLSLIALKIVEIL